MISNGYLFDEQTVQKAVNEWKLYRVQITLDGTEEHYNRRKAYVHPEGSPYQRVIRNIALLDKAGIQVNIRLNTELANVEDIYRLMDELCARFQGCKHVLVYIAPIFENVGAHPVTYNDEKRAELHQLTDQMQWQLIDEGMQSPSILDYCLRYRQCMADSENSTTILPDGHLGRCEHYTDTETYGSIYSDERDKAKLAEWRETIPKQEECKSCFFYPECVILAKCPNHTLHCNPHIRGEGLKKYRASLLTTYQRYLSKQPVDQTYSENPVEC